jgi:hypothetical protein
MNGTRLSNISRYIIIIVSVFFSLQSFSQKVPLIFNESEPLKEDQTLYNGIVWRNLYNFIKGDQFLFYKYFLPGSITINGKTYVNKDISYDIFKDEIITPSNHGFILQLNKEMVDSFSLTYQFKTYRFINTQKDSLSRVNGYVNVLYKGKSALYVKYRKEVELLAVDKKFDLFIQTHRILLLKGGILYQLNGKGDLLRVFQEVKPMIKEFIKKNKITISKNVPESFVPVVRYYDSISK